MEQIRRQIIGPGQAREETRCRDVYEWVDYECVRACTGCHRLPVSPQKPVRLQLLCHSAGIVWFLPILLKRRLYYCIG